VADFGEQREFPHRVNGDGTFDSICPQCYVTIGTSTWEAELERMEAAHVCDPVRLRYYERNAIREGQKPPRSEGSQKIEPIKRVG